MNDKQDDEQGDEPEDSALSWFLRIFLRKHDPAANAFEHDLSDQRRGFIARIHALLHGNGDRKKGDN